MKNISNFFDYIKKRDALRIVKTSGAPWPWSRDKVLSTYRFCNVRREDDWCTKYLFEAYDEAGEIHSYDWILNIILYRRFNTRWFFENVGMVFHDDETLKHLESSLDLAKENGYSLFKDYAYMTSSRPYNPERRPKEKHAQIAMSMNDIAESGALKKPFLNLEAREVWKYLQFPRHGIGPFLAYQILLDISYFYKIKGIEDFVYVGPGAVGGLDIIFGKRRAEPDEEYCRLLRNEQPKAAPFPISLQNIQHNLCEFRKYMNLKHEPKKHRKRYYRRPDELLRTAK